MNNKTEFLHRLKSPSGKSKYKRYGGLPLRYAGGKSLAVGHIVEHIPAGRKRIASPFFGGGSVEIACAKELGMEVWGGDTFQILVNYWQHQIADPAGLADSISKWDNSKETYDEVKKRLKSHWETKPPLLDNMELASHYWYNHNLSYGPGFLGWRSKIYDDVGKYNRMLDKVRHFDGGNITIGSYDFPYFFDHCIYDNTFLYCDPPYYLDGDSKMFKGIYPQRNFPIHHDGFNHHLLAERLKRHNRGGWLLSYNDCDFIRELYKDYDIVEVSWQYTMGQGETRIGKNREEAGADHIKKSHELLIIGY